jgi:hypothetical protein
MKKMVLILFLAGGIFSLFANGKLPNGAEVAELGKVIPLDELKSLNVKGEWEVTVEEGPEFSLIIDATDDDRGWYHYDRGALILGTESKVTFLAFNNSSLRMFRALLILPVLPEEIEASSSSQINIEFPVEREELFLKARSSSGISLEDVRVSTLRLEGSSSSEITLGEVSCHDMEIALSSSSKMTFKEGTVENLQVNCSSSGELDARDLKVGQSLFIEGSSSSEISLGLIESTQIEGQISSSSELTLYGDILFSQLNNLKTSSSGSVEVKTH